MKKITIFYELSPEYIIEKTHCIHLLKVYYDKENESDNELTSETFCGKYSFNKKLEFDNIKLLIPQDWENDQGEFNPNLYDEKKYMDFIRECLTMRQNEHDDVCGNCVARLYKLEIDTGIEPSLDLAPTNGPGCPGM